jgi:hypothetical protein
MYSRWGKLLQVPNYVLDTLAGENWLDGEISFCEEEEGGGRRRKEEEREWDVNLIMLKYGLVEIRRLDLRQSKHQGDPFYFLYLLFLFLFGLFV